MRSSRSSVARSLSPHVNVEIAQPARHPFRLFLRVPMTAEPFRDADPSPSGPPAPPTAAAATPVMAQYHEIKRAHPGCLLFFRMGDFYELFFEDAVAAAPALDIALTKRGRHDGADIPMCGVPVHPADAHLAPLVRPGFHVASS